MTRCPSSRTPAPRASWPGCLAIRAYHAANGEPGRDVCLIPESAHGTNAASAVLAGLRVVVVRCGGDGAIDLADLRAKLAASQDQVAAIMLTYPSTNGVYETTVHEVTSVVHAAGGQVYIDGANLNALAGVTGLVALGADVSHLNLHKTFCIPHGGGGPGVGHGRGPRAPFAVPAGGGPGGWVGWAGGWVGCAGGWVGWAGGWVGWAGGWVGWGKKSRDDRGRPLRLRGHPADLVGVHRDDGRGWAAPGDAGRGAVGELHCPPARPLLPGAVHRSERLVAHECIIDLRHLPGGITNEDVAKRLIDYGFHAPTMSFPVAGTFMIGPLSPRAWRRSISSATR